MAVEDLGFGYTKRIGWRQREALDAWQAEIGVGAVEDGATGEVAQLGSERSKTCWPLMQHRKGQKIHWDRLTIGQVEPIVEDLRAWIASDVKGRGCLTSLVEDLAWRCESKRRIAAHSLQINEEVRRRREERQIAVEREKEAWAAQGGTTPPLLVRVAHHLHIGRAGLCSVEIPCRRQRKDAPSVPVAVYETPEAQIRIEAMDGKPGHFIVTISTDEGRMMGDPDTVHVGKSWTDVINMLEAL